jgi:flagellar basal-body rod modification protein FlgD
MAALAAGILNQHSALHRPITSNAATGNGTEAPGSGSGSISANDFLTLLVTEMKNQDPTANTDPNEYINQLVQVNSLQQLISINQTLTAESATSRGSSAEVSSSSSKLPGQAPSAEPISASHRPSSALPPAFPEAGAVSGNLTIPVTSSAATRVAQALGNH